MDIKTLWGSIWEPSSRIEKGSSLELCNIQQYSRDIYYDKILYDMVLDFKKPTFQQKR